MNALSQIRGLTLSDAIAAARELRPNVLLEQRRAEWRRAAAEIAIAAGTTLEALQRHPDHDRWKTQVRRLVALHLHDRGASLPEIARLLDYRDHTTVLYLLRLKPRQAAPAEQLAS